MDDQGQPAARKKGRGSNKDSGAAKKASRLVEETEEIDGTPAIHYTELATSTTLTQLIFAI
jgi:hypothetical protein